MKFFSLMNFVLVTHQFSSNSLGLSGLGVFSGFHPVIIHTAWSTFLIGLGGFPSAFNSFICYGLIVFKAAIAFLTRGIAFSNSFSHSTLIPWATVAYLFAISSSCSIYFFFGSTTSSDSFLMTLISFSVSFVISSRIGFFSVIYACMTVILSAVWINFSIPS